MNKPANLPRVLVVLGVDDFGPSCDGGGSTSCPHCGAEGRYVINFLCDDGTRRGAMRGCFSLFRGSESRPAKLVQEAFNRSKGLAPGQKLASWWSDILAEVAAFTSAGAQAGDAELLNRRVLEIDARRQAWLKRNGYGYGGKRR